MVELIIIDHSKTTLVIIIIYDSFLVLRIVNEPRPIYTKNFRLSFKYEIFEKFCNSAINYFELLKIY